MIFWHKRKIYKFDPYNVLLLLLQIYVLLMTAFVLQGHQLIPFIQRGSWFTYNWE